jgi:aminopeptidase N
MSFALPVLPAALIASESRAATRSATTPPNTTGASGASGLGDRLYPTLGNGGIDVVNYDLRFAFDEQLATFNATAQLDIVATAELANFTLDFSGALDSVTVGGHRAKFAREGLDDIRITPRTALRRGVRATIEVAYRKKIPKPTTAGPGLVPPTSSKNLYVFSVFQPNTAHRAFPANDHPSDLAQYTITIDTPAKFKGVANGKLASEKSIRGRTIRTFRQDQPIPSNVVQIAAGEWDEIVGSGPHGIELRSFVPKGKGAASAKTLSLLSDQLALLEKHLGRFPYPVYGIVAPPKGSKFGGELETATISLMDGDTIENSTQVAPVLLHEAVHQWFGNSTSLNQWSDVWLNEGHATYYEILWQRTQPGGENPTDIYRSIYTKDAAKMRTEFGPLAAPRGGEPIPFNANVYAGGALALFALYEEVGGETFAQIERTFLQRFRNRSASTDDYIEVASLVAKRDMRPFLVAWLASETLPSMPKHPDWVGS